MKSRTTQSLDVLEILQSQHTEVDALLERLEARTGDVDAIFAELADKLAAHATVEEKIFYPAVFDDDTSDILHESVEEHLEIKRVLADLLELDACDEDDRDEFDAKLSVLKEQVSHHAHEEEEKQLFPILREKLDVDELAALGNEVLAMFETLMDREPRNDVPSETGEAAPLPG
ncbi:MAG TPA: hemerythrin domain-containing protein [Kofleriaceae bacterium]